MDNTENRRCYVAQWVDRSPEGLASEDSSTSVELVHEWKSE